MATATRTPISEMPVVILAGGMGTRLKEETDRLPKPLLPIGERPILWHIMKLYQHHGARRFVLCLGYKSWLIKEYFLRYREHVCDFTLDASNGHAAEFLSKRPGRGELEDHLRGDRSHHDDGRPA